MNRPIKIFILALSILWICGYGTCPATASQLHHGQSSYIPPSLQPWIKWVLDDIKDHNCIPCMKDGKKICNFSGPLSLHLDSKGGTFSQYWQIRQPGWIPLPGSNTHPPQKVLANKKPALVLTKGKNRHGQLGVEINTPGTWLIQGHFSWKTLPRSIKIPEQTGLIHPLVINESSKSVQRSGNTLWLAPLATNKKKQTNKVFTKVYRKITDSVPMMITTNITLDITGEPRNILLDWAIPKEEIPVRVESTLGIEMDKNNRIHVQAAPGKYTITCVSRIQDPKGPVSSIKRAENALGPDTEYWSFEAQNNLRMVHIVSDAPAVDPAQTSIPDNWQKLPAYLVKKGQKLEFQTLKRGMDKSPANDLSITRRFWLDQDGKGITVQDDIRGNILGNPRLSAQSPMKLGQVVIDGKDQLITQISEDTQPGVEVRKGRLHATAVSRLENTRTFPAAGWGQPMNHESARLILPPGWALFHASGVDTARTWISSWTLLDCFLVLITALACFRLLGIFPAIIALAAIGLCLHDPKAPVFIWLWILGAMGLMTVLPQGRIKNLLGYAKHLLIIAAILIALPYGVTELQTGFFPQLEEKYSPAINHMKMTGKAKTKKAPMYEEDSLDVRAMAMPEALSEKQEVLFAQQAKSIPSSSQKYTYMEEQMNIAGQVQTGKVQAGPGLPETNWKQIRLDWNGPVEPELSVRLFLISPAMNLVLAFVKVAATFGLIFSLAIPRGMKFHARLQPNGGKTATTAILLLALLLSGTVMPSRAAAKNFPNKNLLDTLQKRLTEPAPCFPECADFSSMEISWEDKEMRLSISASCAAETCVPLPMSNEISWQEIHLDNKDNKSASQPVSLRHGTLWLPLQPGHHTITMTGRTKSNELRMDLPLAPHIVTCKPNKLWQIRGIDANGVPGSQLQCIRKSPNKGIETETPTSSLPPLLRIHRTLHLGLQWTITTTIQRLSPKGDSIFLSVPLMETESPIDGGYKIKNNCVEVSLAPKEESCTWTSVLKKQSILTMKAPDTTTWYEVWEMEASPVWHTEIQGLSPIHGFNKQGEFRPIWYPWPKETTTIAVTRPKGIKGNTKIIDSARLTVEPGLASTKFFLEFSIRSTMGGQHTIMLPEESTILSVMVNGQSQTPREDNQIIFPLRPASSRVAIRWKSNQRISTAYSVPKIDLGASGVNAHMEIRTKNRWILFVKGPVQGPAILFFGEAIVILAAGFLLGRLRFSPLGALQWIVLGLGISQSGLIPGIIIAAWFGLLWTRKEKGGHLPAFCFNFMQILLVISTLAALGALLFAIQHGLLGHPDMMIRGNGSTNSVLRWYQDRMPQGILPQPGFWSIPVAVYRAIMLAWALWLAISVLKWAQWAWQCVSSEKLWEKIQWRRPGKKTETTSERKTENP